MRMIGACLLCTLLIGCGKEPSETTVDNDKEAAQQQPASELAQDKKAIISTPDEVEADCVEIAYAYGTQMIGGVKFRLGPDLILGSPEPVGPVTVTIFREMAPQHMETAEQWGVKVGGAYIKRGPRSYEYIRDVDLSLSDEELAAQFGVPSLE